MEALDTFMCPWLGLKRRGKESSKRSYSLSLSLSLSLCVCLSVSGGDGICSM